MLIERSRACVPSVPGPSFFAMGEGPLEMIPASAALKLPGILLCVVGSLSIVLGALCIFPGGISSGSTFSLFAESTIGRPTGSRGVTALLPKELPDLARPCLLTSASGNGAS